MLYAALTFWLLVIIFAAWGVHRLWSAMLQPRVVNGVLLPGTLAAQLGHVLGLLVTGHAVTNTALMTGDERGEPVAEPPPTPKIPVIGSIVVGLLPLVACAVALYLVVVYWGATVLSAGAAEIAVPVELPTTRAGLFELLRSTVTNVERLVAAVSATDLMNWENALFVYLVICLTVRMAPFPGHRRGAVAAILLTGLLTALLASFAPQVREFVVQRWGLLSFAAVTCLTLLVASLAVSGLVGVVRIFAKNE